LTTTVFSYFIAVVGRTFSLMRSESRLVTDRRHWTTR